MDQVYVSSGALPSPYVDLADTIYQAVDWSRWLDRNLTETASPLPEVLLSIKTLLITFDSFRFVHIIATIATKICIAHFPTTGRLL
jgi:hypothetical protein